MTKFEGEMKSVAQQKMCKDSLVNQNNITGR